MVKSRGAVPALLVDGRGHVGRASCFLDATLEGLVGLVLLLAAGQRLLVTVGRGGLLPGLAALSLEQHLPLLLPEFSLAGLPLPGLVGHGLLAPPFLVGHGVLAPPFLVGLLPPCLPLPAGLEPVPTLGLGLYLCLCLCLCLRLRLRLRLGLLPLPLLGLGHHPLLVLVRRPLPQARVDGLEHARQHALPLLLLGP